jgi:hypothetical protein
MSDSIKFKTFQINYKGDILFLEWYKILYDWLIRNDFYHADTGDALIEDYHLEQQFTGGAMKSRWIWWRTKRVEGPMFEFKLNVDFQTLGMSDKEIIHRGKKLKINYGEINLFITAEMIIDPQNMWQKNWLAKEMYDLLKRREFNEQIEFHKKKLYKLVVELHDRAKQSLQLETMVKREESFIPLGGYPDL